MVQIHQGEDGSTVCSDNNFETDVFMKAISEVEESSAQVIGLIDNLESEIKSGKLGTNDGISLLDVKNQMMLSYLTNLTYVVAKKLCGEHIEGDTAIERLVEIRTVLERIRPLEHKLKYMMDKLIKTALTGNTNDNDPTHCQANPVDLVEHMDSNSDSEEDQKTAQRKKTETKQGLYVPPRLAPMHYDEEENVETRRRKQLEQAKRRALHSSVVGELREQYLETPAEVSHGNALRATESRKQRIKNQYEEEYMTRLPTSKKDRHRGRHSMAIGNIGDHLTYFEDIQVLEDEGAMTRPGKRQKSAKKFDKKKSFKRRRTH